jgi:hypothetical protein
VDEVDERKQKNFLILKDSDTLALISSVGSFKVEIPKNLTNRKTT